MRYIYKTEHYLAIKKGVLSFAAKCVGLEDIVLSEIKTGEVPHAPLICGS
jgi:hypothetical protein